jgi:rhamnose transport system ATP-binding protein
MRDPAWTLSGGNQQKVVLGKWLAREPELLIIDEPTRGIDVGTKAEVHRILDELAARGMAVLMISSELPEVLGVADRILVLHEGRLAAEIARGEASEDAIMRAATGQAPKDAA